MYVSDLKPPSLFVQFMDGPPALSKLVKKVFDFVSQILIFSPEKKTGKTSFDKYRLYCCCQL